LNFILPELKALVPVKQKGKRSRIYDPDGNRLQNLGSDCFIKTRHCIPGFVIKILAQSWSLFVTIALILTPGQAILKNPDTILEFNNLIINYL
jgi:hypothetical protein